MVTSFLITLREGLEASLIIAILLTYLTKTNRQHEAKYVWMGTAAAIGACLVAGTLIYILLMVCTAMPNTPSKASLHLLQHPCSRT